jgi:glycosyltransferase involved in cell wall biosynthesis
LEALAAGRPVVTTPVGHEGLNVVAGEHVLVARDPAAFAASVVELCRDAGHRARLGRAGRQLVERSYGWDRAGELLAQLYKDITERKAVKTHARR